MKSKKYVVTFYVDVEAPDEGDDTDFTVEQHVRKFLLIEMQAREYGKVRFGAIEDVGALDFEEWNKKGE